MAHKRIQKELYQIRKETLENQYYYEAGPIEQRNLHKWQGTIVGPEGTPYEGGIFHLQIDFPVNYPLQPPKIQFITPIYHPNIGLDGRIYVDILGQQWCPTFTISNVLRSIHSLLTDPSFYKVARKDLEIQYITNRKQYDMTVRQWVIMYALPNMN